MLKQYVDNWASVLMVYSGAKKHTTAKFKDGATVELTKQAYKPFYEALYRRHLQANGFVFLSDGKVQTPDGLVLIIPEMYALVLDEIFLMQVYGKPDLSGKVVVDVGAAIGDTALYFSKLGAKHVYAYEMDSERCKIAVENVALNGLQDKITIIERAADAESINATKPDFIKIDCEGCEYELLPRLDLKDVKQVLLEYHHETQPLKAVLEKAGFDVSVRGEIMTGHR